jgi:hypothetical protein
MNVVLIKSINYLAPLMSHFSLDKNCDRASNAMLSAHITSNLAEGCNVHCKAMRNKTG